MTEQLKALMPKRGASRSHRADSLPPVRQYVPGGQKFGGLTPWEYYRDKSAHRPEGSLLSEDTLSGTIVLPGTEG